MKQVIVMRKDLNMRKGKMIVQGAHACMGFFIGSDIQPDMNYLLSDDYDPPPYDYKQGTSKYQNFMKWVPSGMTKVCVGVESKEELDAIVSAAKEAKLVVHTVTDAGKTELESGTITCCAIGPNDDEEIDKITGHLRLL